MKIDDQIERLKGRGYVWPIPWAAVEDMARREDCRLIAYLCIAGRWTCGWGETEGVTAATRWTDSEADERLHHELCEFTESVRRMLDYSNPNQLGAMTSLAYNIGLTAFSKSTVLRKHNAGDTEGAARAFGMWNKYKEPKTGLLTVADGLTTRRAMERARYLMPAPGAKLPMPQAVVGEDVR